MEEFLTALAIGFVAQLIDGALGMAYGVSASSMLVFFGVPPAVTSATVHAAEVFSTGASALSHHHFRNIDKALFKKLAVSGVFGAITGAFLLSVIDAGSMKAYFAFYLLIMGLYIIRKAFKVHVEKKEIKHVPVLGFTGACLDSLGGGGWGPIVASSLLAQGSDVRKTVGTVNSSEFLVTLASTVTFSVTLGLTHANLIAGLAVGGIFAAPIGAYLCKRLPRKTLMITIGVLICLLSLINMGIFK